MRAQEHQSLMASSGNVMAKWSLAAVKLNLLACSRWSDEQMADKRAIPCISVSRSWDAALRLQAAWINSKAPGSSRTDQCKTSHVKPRSHALAKAGSFDFTSSS